MGLSNSLPKDLITVKNTRDLEIMAHLYEKMTDFPREELIVLWEKYFVLPKKGGGENTEKPADNHPCLIFPFVGEITQGYDCVTNVALHMKKSPGDKNKVLPVYVPNEDFRIIAPFVLMTTLAVTKNGNRPVIINMKGRIVLDPAPDSLLRGLLH